MREYDLERKDSNANQSELLYSVWKQGFSAYVKIPGKNTEQKRFNVSYSLKPC